MLRASSFLTVDLIQQLGDYLVLVQWVSIWVWAQDLTIHLLRLVFQDWYWRRGKWRILSGRTMSILLIQSWLVSLHHIIEASMFYLRFLVAFFSLLRQHVTSSLVIFFGFVSLGGLETKSLCGNLPLISWGSSSMRKKLSISNVEWWIVVGLRPPQIGFGWWLDKRLALAWHWLRRVLWVLGPRDWVR